jgi:cbb3-type cytochrome oxidase subunit 3
MKPLLQDKKGQLASILLVVITLFVIGIILFFFNHLNKQVYDSLDDYFEGNEGLNQSEAHNATVELQGIEGSNIWDYAFLAIFFGMMLQMLIFSFASRTNVAFFWLFVVAGIVILIVGVALSNIWQEIAADPEFATTITRFTITNTLLGTYYPTIITGVMFLGMIIMFGKFPGQQEQ